MGPRTNPTLLLLISLTALAASGCEPTISPCLEDYQGCGDGEPCATGATCEHLAWTFGEGDICMRGCDDQRDCPRQDGREARCMDVAGDGRSACYRTCFFDTDCPVDWVCQPVRSPVGSTLICLP